jgi:hypothetical protein
LFSAHRPTSERVRDVLDFHANRGAAREEKRENQQKLFMTDLLSGCCDTIPSSMGRELKAC